MNETNDVVEKLEELGNILIKCREIPPEFFDEYGKRFCEDYLKGTKFEGIKDYRGKKLYNFSDFEIQPEEESGEESGQSVSSYYKIKELHGGVVIYPENNSFNALVFTGSGKAYYFSRTNFGSVGETLTLADFEYIHKSYGERPTAYNTTTCLILGEPILEIGRNKHFNPKTLHSLLEEEYVSGLLENFGGFLEEHYTPVSYVVVGETGDKMEIYPQGNLSISTGDIEELVNRFTGLLQEYKG